MLCLKLVEAPKKSVMVDSLLNCFYLLALGVVGHF